MDVFKSTQPIASQSSLPFVKIIDSMSFDSLTDYNHSESLYVIHYVIIDDFIVFDKSIPSLMRISSMSRK